MKFLLPVFKFKLSSFFVTGSIICACCVSPLVDKLEDRSSSTVMDLWIHRYGMMCSCCIQNNTTNYFDEDAFFSETEGSPIK
jgi:hypothetical protein